MQKMEVLEPKPLDYPKGSSVYGLRSRVHRLSSAMKRTLTKELLFLLGSALPVLVQFAILESEDAGAIQFFAEVGGVYAAVCIVRFLRWSAGMGGKQKSAKLKSQEMERVEMQLPVGDGGL